MPEVRAVAIIVAASSALMSGVGVAVELPASRGMSVTLPRKLEMIAKSAGHAGRPPYMSHVPVVARQRCRQRMRAAFPCAHAAATPTIFKVVGPRVVAFRPLRDACIVPNPHDGRPVALALCAHADTRGDGAPSVTSKRSVGLCGGQWGAACFARVAHHRTA
jgi:hypothetical protein